MNVGEVESLKWVKGFCHRKEAIVIEQLILGVFLVLPLVIVAVLFSDELWQEHRRQHPRDENAPHIDWKHPWRRVRRGH